MGCDIHPKAEVFINGKWMRCEDDGACVPRDRDYATFGVLAGIRREDMPRIADPRGFPTDMAWEVSDRPGGAEFGDHSFSWVTLREMIKAWDTMTASDQQEACLLGKLIDHLAEYVSDDVAPEHIRLVFGFDS